MRIAAIGLVAWASCQPDPEPPPRAVTAAPAPATATPEAPVTAAPRSADVFPELDATCASDADCTVTGQFAGCCGECERKYCSRAFVERVTAYCAAHPPGTCPPRACSWGYVAPRCVDGVCRAPGMRPRDPAPGR